MPYWKYWKDTWTFPNSNEYEYKFAGRYGAKGEKRQQREKATPEQIQKQNQSNREKKVRREMERMKYLKRSDIERILSGFRSLGLKRYPPYPGTQEFSRQFKKASRLRSENIKFSSGGSLTSEV